MLGLKLNHVSKRGHLWNQMTFERLVQDRCNSIANALELRLSCIDPLIWRVNERWDNGMGSCHTSCERELSSILITGDQEWSIIGLQTLGMTVYLDCSLWWILFSFLLFIWLLVVLLVQKHCTYICKWPFAKSSVTLIYICIYILYICKI